MSDTPIQLSKSGNEDDVRTELLTFCERVANEMTARCGFVPLLIEASPDQTTVKLKVFYSQEPQLPTHCPEDKHIVIHFRSGFASLPGTRLPFALQGFIAIFQSQFPHITRLELFNEKLELSC